MGFHQKSTLKNKVEHTQRESWPSKWPISWRSAQCNSRTRVGSRRCSGITTRGFRKPVTQGEAFPESMRNELREIFRGRAASRISHWESSGGESERCQHFALRMDRRNKPLPTRIPEIHRPIRTALGLSRARPGAVGEARSMGGTAAEVDGGSLAIGRTGDGIVLSTSVMGTTKAFWVEGRRGDSQERLPTPTRQASANTAWTRTFLIQTTIASAGSERMPACAATDNRYVVALTTCLPSDGSRSVH